ncbi:MAG: hypothetical protein ACYDC3_14160 [Candidatus Binataceae bacterium]
MLVASSFAVLTCVQLLQPLGSIALKQHPAATSSHWCGYRHTIEEVGTAGGAGAPSGVMGFQRIGFNLMPIRRSIGVRGAGLNLSLWREQSLLFRRKLPPASADPGH